MTEQERFYKRLNGTIDRTIAGIILLCKKTPKWTAYLSAFLCTLVLAWFLIIKFEEAQLKQATEKSTANFEAIMERQNKAVKNS